MITRVKRSKIRWVGSAAVVTFVALTAGIIVAREDIADRFVDDAEPKPSTSPPPGLSADEQAFYAFVAPRLARISAESEELVDLAEERSRNLLELQTRGERIDEGAQEIDDYVSAHGVPDRFAAAHHQYRQGIAGIRAGMEEARTGFLRFDWDRVAAAVDRFTEGADDLAAALEALHRAAGVEPQPSPRSSTDTR